jgi:hypothetical protein
VTAKATDDSGRTTDTSPVRFYVHGPGGNPPLPPGPVLRTRPQVRIGRQNHN